MATSAYARSQVDDTPENPFSDSISPPLFLMLTVMILQIIVIAMHDTGATLSNPLAQLIFGNEQYRLIYLSVAYCLWPLIYAAGALRRAGKPLNRETLRGPFFAQCFLVAPFAFGLNVSVVFMHTGGDIGALFGFILLLVSLIWYTATQTFWIRTELNYSTPRSFGLALWYFALGSGLNALISYVLRTF
ncbi:hypothetical protein Q1W73_12830 [Asticcacaulis sp. ZE23SCel15]|uniref:hypothetical protein n=1 Tax=Asticcacaulis sp. ZE23SCel15 TaxID=3059027 RepID=UPI00265DFDC9|nr:hypothetical protein [Asticcacaulis sp. ZE23SCel15]WKL56565.1 hypothetical protein Q1W73_12830 [Asticcacaulis sp. ZE23SCel15]